MSSRNATPGKNRRSKQLFELVRACRERGITQSGSRNGRQRPAGRVGSGRSGRDPGGGAPARLGGDPRTAPPIPRLSSGLLVKPESLQPTVSFKLRGACTAISVSGPQAWERGGIAHSSGNHGHAAALLSVSAVVVVPNTALQSQDRRDRVHGAELVTVPPTMAARVATTKELVARHGYVLIPPFDDGQSSPGRARSAWRSRPTAPSVDLGVVPVSGGGLISGVAAGRTSVSPGAVVVGVEPELASDARDSFRSGEPVAWPAADVQRTIADALRVERVGIAVRAYSRTRDRHHHGDRGRDANRRQAAGYAGPA